MLTFWLITVLMALIVAGFIYNGFTRGNDSGEAPARAAYDVSVYRAQLDEIARDVARGVVPEQDAERLRTEISRRILAADDASVAAPVAAPKGAKWAMGAIAGLAVLGSYGLYLQIGQPGYGDLALKDRIAQAEERRRNRPGQAVAEAGLNFETPVEVNAQYLDLVAQLRATVAERPDDLKGHQLLAQSEANITNFSGAAQAQANVLRIKEDSASVTDIADYAEFLVLAAGGYVSPEAEAALRQALAQDDQDPRSRYYFGLMTLQNDRPDQTLRLWDDLLRRGPEDAPWIPPIQAQILDVAELAGVRYEIPPIGTGAAPRPTAADIDAAGDLSPAERMEMIGAMVEGLSNRLASEGGPPADWARLITSLGVLDQRAQALAVYNNALQVFGEEPGALDIIRRAGEQAGIAG